MEFCLPAFREQRGQYASVKPVQCLDRGHVPLGAFFDLTEFFGDQMFIVFLHAVQQQVECLLPLFRFFFSRFKDA